MKKLYIATLTTLLLSACSQPEKAPIINAEIAASEVTAQINTSESLSTPPQIIPGATVVIPPKSTASQEKVVAPNIETSKPVSEKNKAVSHESSAPVKESIKEVSKERDSSRKIESSEPVKEKKLLAQRIMKKTASESVSSQKGIVILK